MTDEPGVRRRYRHRRRQLLMGAAILPLAAAGLVTGAAVVTAGTPTITVSPAMLPAANVGTAYSQTITASGGTSPYTYIITAGPLPTGLSLSTAGALSGTPTAVGMLTFTVTATDSSTGGGPLTGSRTYSLLVTKAAVTATVSASPTSIVVGQTVTFTAVFTAPAGASAKPTGTALLLEGLTVLGRAIVDPGTAVFATNLLGTGTHTLSVDYLGDANYQSLASAATITITVQATPIPNTGFNSQPQPWLPGLILLLGGIGLVIVARRTRNVT